MARELPLTGLLVVEIASTTAAGAILADLGAEVRRVAPNDLTHRPSLARLHRLIAQRADVVLHDLAPSVAAGHGLDADGLRVTKPELVHCEIGAVGPTAAVIGVLAALHRRHRKHIGASVDASLLGHVLDLCP